MKVYEIRNNEYVFAYFFYIPEKDECYIELNDAPYYPVFFELFKNKGITTLNEDWTRNWIGERVIPADRQNIAQILKTNGYKTYNEIELLLASKAKSSMDDNFLKQISYNDISDYVNNKRKMLIKDFIKVSNNNLIIFFEDGASKEYHYTFQTEEEPFLTSFGNEIIFNSSYRISYEELYSKGKSFILNYDNLVEYLNKNILTSSDVQKELNVSRQYVGILEKNGAMRIKNKFFLKNDLKTYKNKY